MRILFCKISSMKYYKGACDLDVPMYGGKFVEENGYGHEEFNFLPIEMEGIAEPECVGFVEPKSNRGVRNTLHIEKIEGCAAMKKEPLVDDVLVIWCAKRDRGDVTVVGWYKHATVWRDVQDWTIMFDNGMEEERGYNVRAKASDCTLLPSGERNRAIWSIPSAKYTGAYGFGQSMVWYPTEPEAENYLTRLLKNIESYRDENWLNKWPEE
jgi:hypothetical protein